MCSKVRGKERGGEGGAWGGKRGVGRNLGGSGQENDIGCNCCFPNISKKMNQPMDIITLARTRTIPPKPSQSYSPSPPNHPIPHYPHQPSQQNGRRRTHPKPPASHKTRRRHRNPPGIIPQRPPTLALLIEQPNLP